MRTRSLLNQVLAVNAALVAVTAVVSALLSPKDTRGLILIGIAIVSAVLGTMLLLKPRLVPLEDLLMTLERVDPSSPGHRAAAPVNAPREVAPMTAGFNYLLA